MSVWENVESTCAADGMCATSCPVSIDTGKVKKQLVCVIDFTCGWHIQVYERISSKSSI